MQRPEDRLQARCARYLRDAIPAPGWWSSIEHASKRSLFAGQMLKSKGVQRGLSDIMIFYCGKFIAIELKVKAAVSLPQWAFGAAMKSNGFEWYVIRTVENLHDTLLDCGIPILPSMRIAAQNHDAALSVAPKSKAPRSPRPTQSRKPSAARIKRVTASVYGVEI